VRQLAPLLFAFLLVPFGSACDREHTSALSVANGSEPNGPASSRASLSFQALADGRWDGKADESVAALAELGRADLPDDAFRFYHLNEAEYARESRELESDAEAFRRFGEDFLERVRRRRVFLNNAVSELSERAAYGASPEITSALDALQRVARVSSEEGEIEVGRRVMAQLEPKLERIESVLASR